MGNVSVCFLIKSKRNEGELYFLQNAEICPYRDLCTFRCDKTYKENSIEKYCKRITQHKTKVRLNVHSDKPKFVIIPVLGTGKKNAKQIC